MYNKIINISLLPIKHGNKTTSYLFGHLDLVSLGQPADGRPLYARLRPDVVPGCPALNHLVCATPPTAPGLGRAHRLGRQLAFRRELTGQLLDQVFRGLMK